MRVHTWHIVRSFAILVYIPVNWHKYRQTRQWSTFVLELRLSKIQVLHSKLRQNIFLLFVLNYVRKFSRYSFTIHANCRKHEFLIVNTHTHNTTHLNILPKMFSQMASQDLKENNERIKHFLNANIHFFAARREQCISVPARKHRLNIWATSQFIGLERS